MADYQKIATETRLKVLELIYKGQTSHIGSNFSVIDMAVVLYQNLKPEDEVIWSKGWASATKYILEDYDTTNFPEDPPSLLLTGSAGHGLPIGVGLALSKKRTKKSGTVYVIMSDGEMNCGTTWESALLASHHKLDNLVVLVDRNGLQAMGKTEDIVKLEPLESKWDSFGWDKSVMDGHRYRGIDLAIDMTNGVLGRPSVVIFNTIKGKGVNFMENDNNYHYLQLTKEDYEAAVHQLSN